MIENIGGPAPGIAACAGRQLRPRGPSRSSLDTRPRPDRPGGLSGAPPVADFVRTRAASWPMCTCRTSTAHADRHWAPGEGENRSGPDVFSRPSTRATAPPISCSKLRDEQRIFRKASPFSNSSDWPPEAKRTGRNTPPPRSCNRRQATARPFFRPSRCPAGRFAHDGRQRVHPAQRPLTENGKRRSSIAAGRMISGICLEPGKSGPGPGHRLKTACAQTKRNGLPQTTGQPCRKGRKGGKDQHSDDEQPHERP